VHARRGQPGTRAAGDGSVESLVKWVKGNFLAGREFADAPMTWI
jgi:hypothetical protein